MRGWGTIPGCHDRQEQIGAAALRPDFHVEYHRRVTPMDLDPNLKPLIPPILLRAPEFADRGEHRAAILFVDVAGFTGLSEALARLGPEGAEILERTIAEYFNALLDLVDTFGGIPIKIGGDALTVAFIESGQSLEGLVRTAIACAAALSRSLCEDVRVTTPEGVVRIAHKVGVGCGTLVSGLVGDPSIRLELAMVGESLDQAAAAEHKAVAGEVWASPRVVEVLDDPGIWDRHDDGFARLAPSLLPAPPPGRGGSVSDSTDLAEWHLTLVPATVRESAEKGTLKFLRRHQSITVLFVSFQGMDFTSTACFDLLDRHYRSMQAIVEAHGGFLSEFEAGDKGAKLIVLFGAPVPIEDPVGQAVRCAWAMQDAARTAGVVTDQRIGMTTGRLYVGRIGCRSLAKISALGDHMNLAARLMTASRPWSVLAEATVARRTADRARWSRPELLRVKGKQALVSTAYLERLDERVGIERRGVGLAGRRGEKRVLREIHQRLVDGVGTLVRITGEPGVGKTRLLDYMRRLVKNAGEVRLIESHDYALVPHSEPFHAWRSLLLDVIGIDDQLEQEAKVKVFSAWLDGLPADLRKTCAHLAPILEIPWPSDPIMDRLKPDQQLRVLEDAVMDCLHHGCTDVSRCLIIDNAHHIDAPSRSVLFTIAPLLGQLRLSIVMAGRTSQGREEDPFLPLKNQPNCIHIVVPPLDREESAELMRNMLGTRYLDSELEAFVHEKAQGNPLRIEAWLNILNDRGHIGRDGDVASLTGHHHGLTIPDRLESLALVNLESLPQDAQLTLRVASVIGLSFTARDVAGLHPQRLDTRTIARHLHLGQQAKLLYYQRGDSRRMFFNRPEVRDALHDSLPFELRRHLHRKRAQQIKANLGGIVDDEAWLALARHHEYIGEPLAQTRYFRKAADICIKRHDHRQAVRWLYRLVDACKQRHDVGGILNAYRHLHNELSMLGEHAEDRELLDAWIQFATEEQRHHSLVEALEVRARWFQRRGNTEEAKQDLNRAIKIASEKCSERLPVVYGSLSIMWTEMGCPRSALEAVEKALEGADAVGLEQDINLLVARGNALSALGRASEAYEAFKEVLPLLDERDLWTRSIVEGNIAVELFNLGRFEEGHESLVRTLELKREVGDRREEAVALGNVGYSSYRIGHLEEARRYTEECIRLSRRLRYFRVEMNAAGNLGEILWTMGELDEAARQYDRVDALLSQNSNRHLQLEQRIRRGELELSRGEALRALTVFGTALEESREAKLKGFEPAALEGLAEAHRVLGHHHEAMVLFQEVVERAQKTPHLLAFPQRAFLRAARAATDAGDTTAADTLMKQARAALNEALKHLSRESTRVRFVQAFPWNREILEFSGHEGTDRETDEVRPTHRPAA